MINYSKLINGCCLDVELIRVIAEDGLEDTIFSFLKGKLKITKNDDSINEVEIFFYNDISIKESIKSTLEETLLKNKLPITVFNFSYNFDQALGYETSQYINHMEMNKWIKEFQEEDGITDEFVEELCELIKRI